MDKKSTGQCINKILRDLKSFGITLEIDNKTYEVLGVRYPRKFLSIQVSVQRNQSLTRLNSTKEDAKLHLLNLAPYPWSSAAYCCIKRDNRE